MILSLASLFFAADQQPGINPLYLLLMMGVLMYFMMIRPQRRMQKEHQARLAALKSGDEIITNGGIHGLVTNVAERTLTLKIADNVKIKIERQCVATIVKKSDEPEPESKDKDKDKEKEKDDDKSKDEPVASRSPKPSTVVSPSKTHPDSDRDAPGLQRN